jgi:hypothetical protein
MLTRVASALVIDFAYIERVRENVVDVTAPERTPAKYAAGCGSVPFGREFAAVQFGRDQADVLEINVASLTMRARSLQS